MVVGIRKASFPFSVFFWSQSCHRMHPELSLRLSDLPFTFLFEISSMFSFHPASGSNSIITCSCFTYRLPIFTTCNMQLTTILAFVLTLLLPYNIPYPYSTKATNRSMNLDEPTLAFLIHPSTNSNFRINTQSSSDYFSIPSRSWLQLHVLHLLILAPEGKVQTRWRQEERCVHVDGKHRLEVLLLLVAYLSWYISDWQSHWRPYNLRMSSMIGHQSGVKTPKWCRR